MSATGHAANHLYTLAASIGLGGSAGVLTAQISHDPQVIALISIVGGAVGHGLARAIDTTIAWYRARLQADAKKHGVELKDEDPKA